MWPLDLPQLQQYSTWIFKVISVLIWISLLIRFSRCSMFFWKNRSYFFFACLQKLQVWKKSDTEILQLQKKVFSKTVIVSFMIWNPGKSDSFKSTSVSLAN